MVAVGRNVLTLVVLLAGCRQILGLENGTVVELDGPVDVADSLETGAAYRKVITIESPAGEELIDFPVPIMRGVDLDLAAHAADDARDVHFVMGSEVLPYELVSFDGAEGSLEAWVSVPKLQGTVAIELRYGGAPVDHDASRVWSGPYAGVWHMTPSSMQQYLDSTPHVHHGSANDNMRPAAVPGIAGVAGNYDGEKDSIGIGDPADGSLDFIDGFAMSVWVKVSTSVGSYDMPLSKGGSSPAMPGYDIELGAGAWSTYLSDGAQTAIVSYGMEPELIGRWTHLAVVVDRATAKVRAYVDGATKQEVMLPASFGSIATSAPLELGRSQTYVFRGVLDEVRIYNKPRTAGWFAAEHRFLTAPSESIVVGFEEPL